MKKTEAYKYAVQVDGRIWCRGDSLDAMRAAIASATKGWAKGRRIRLIKTKGKEAEEE